MSTNVLITGGSGFVGRNVINALRALRPDLSIYNYSTTPVDGEDIANITGDAAAFDPTIFEGCTFDYIIHLLALSNEAYCKDFSYAERINVGFTKQLLAYAKTHASLKKFVHLSSIIIYDNGNPLPVSEDGRLNFNYTTYSFTKGVSEAYADFYRTKLSLPVTILRLSNIYGPFQSFKDSPFLVPSKIVDALQGKDISVFSLTPQRDWIYAPDAAESIVCALDAETGIYNLASGKGTSVEEIIAEISRQLGVKYSSLNKETTGPLNLYCDISKIKKAFGWKPKTALKDGLAETIAYIKKESTV